MSNAFDKVCHKAAVNGVYESFGESKLSEPKANKNLPAAKISEPTPRTLLRLIVSETSNKEVASMLGVSETIVSQWVAGDKDIPEMRQLAILRGTKYFLKMKMRKMLEIDDYIDLLETIQFGEVHRG